MRYSTDKLIAWAASVVPVCLSHDVVVRVQQLGISCRHSGCRARKSVRSRNVRLQPAGNGDYVISGNRPSPHCRRVYHDNWSPSNLITMPVLRHAGSTAGRTLGFASLNVRSLSPHNSTLCSSSSVIARWTSSCWVRLGMTATQFPFVDCVPTVSPSTSMPDHDEFRTHLVPTTATLPSSPLPVSV